jgi:hypothetical protein
MMKIKNTKLPMKNNKTVARPTATQEIQPRINTDGHGSELFTPSVSIRVQSRVFCASSRLFHVLSFPFLHEIGPTNRWLAFLHHRSNHLDDGI